MNSGGGDGMNIPGSVARLALSGLQEAEKLQGEPYVDTQTWIDPSTGEGSLDFLIKAGNVEGRLSYQRVARFRTNDEKTGYRITGYGMAERLCRSGRGLTGEVKGALSSVSREFGHTDTQVTILALESEGRTLIVGSTVSEALVVGRDMERERMKSELQGEFKMARADPSATTVESVTSYDLKIMVLDKGAEQPRELRSMDPEIYDVIAEAMRVMLNGENKAIHPMPPEYVAFLKQKHEQTHAGQGSSGNLPARQASNSSSTRLAD